MVKKLRNYAVSGRANVNDIATRLEVIVNNCRTFIIMNGVVPSEKKTYNRRQLRRSVSVIVAPEELSVGKAN